MQSIEHGKTMQGLVFLGDRKVELRDFRVPTPGPGEVIVKIAASGMCGSDLHVYRGPALGTEQSAALNIGGHEPAGTVFEIGIGVLPELASVGDRVMVHHYSGCMTCIHCRSGWPQMCIGMDYRLYGTNEHGAHAPYMKVPASTLVRLEDTLSFEVGAAIGCGTGTAWGGIHRLGDVGGATIAIFGQGPVGLSATMLATARGARVIAVDISADRLNRAKDFGAAVVVNSAEVDVVEVMRDLTNGQGVQLALETSGSSIATTNMLKSLGKWGRACLIGLGGKVEFSVQEYLQRQITLMTSWSMSIVDQEQCAEFVADKQLPVDELFSHRWNLAQAEEAYAKFDKQDAGKGVFVF